MDSFSVSDVNGLNEPEMSKKKMYLIAATFGGFQAGMPMIGWFCVHVIAEAFETFHKMTPVIALVLLLYIGGKKFADISDEGIIEEEQGDIIQSALDFADTNVKEVLTPRNKIFALNIRELDKEKLHKIIINTNYSRIPIYDGNFDNIIGVLHIKTYLSAYLRNPNVSIKRKLQKPYFVSSNIMIDDLFNGFKKHHTHIAIVRDKNKKVIGMVTMDDVLEELVSDISEPTQVKGRR